MRKLLLAGAAVIAIVASPGAILAQSTVGNPEPTRSSEMPTNVPPPSPGSTTPDESSVPPAPDSSSPDAAAPSAATTADQAPASTQAQTPASKPTLTADQQAVYNGWPPARQAEYEALPNDQKVFFWKLTPDRQEGYWALTTDQRGQIYKMNPQQQEIAWQSVMQQLKGQTPPPATAQANPQGEGTPTSTPPNPQVAGEPVNPAMPADKGYQGGPYKGALTPPPETAMNKSYPLCTKKIQDSCRNRGGV